MGKSEKARIILQKVQNIVENNSLEQAYDHDFYNESCEEEYIVFWELEYLESCGQLSSEAKKIFRFLNEEEIKILEELISEH